MPETRQDVAWAVLFRLARTGVWCEWSTGHRSPSEALAEAEALAGIKPVVDIRFERRTGIRERFTRDELPEGTNL